MSYVFSLERGDINYTEIEPLYRRHYSEMQARLERDGMPVGNYNPNLSAYFEAFSNGSLLNFIVRKGGEAVGYCNVYLTNDMHNSELIAQEDLIYIVPECRDGVGRKLVKHILHHLQGLGVRRVHITPVTDLRVAKIWKRMGFKEVATQMVYNFTENTDVLT